MTKFGKIALCLGALLAGGLLRLVLVEHGRLGIARETIELERTALASIRERGARQQHTLAEMRTALASMTAGGWPETPTARQELSSGPLSGQHRPSLARLMVDHPRLHRLYVEARRLGTEFEYAKRFSELGFTEQQRQRATDTLARSIERWIDIRVAARAANLTEADGAIAALMADYRAARAKELHAAIGIDHIMERDPRDRAFAYHDTIAALSRASIPIRDDQAKALRALLYDEEASLVPGRGRRRQGEGWVNMTREDYDIVIAKSATFLSPAQQEIAQMYIEHLWAGHAAERWEPPKP